MRMLPKILLAFLILVILCLLQGLFGVWSIRSVTDVMAGASSYPVRQVDAARSAWNTFGQASDFLGNELQTIEHKDTGLIIKQFSGLTDETAKSIESSLDNNPTKSGRILGEQTRADLAAWQADAMILLGGKPANFIPSPHKMDQRQQAIGKQLNDLVAVALASADASRAEMAVSAGKSAAILLMLAAASVLAGTMIAVLLAIGISRPLVRIEKCIGALMNGDMTSAIVGIARRDEIGAIAKAVDFFRGRIKERTEAIDRERIAVRESIGKGLEMLAAKDLTYRLKHDLPEAYVALQNDFNSALDQLEEVIAAVSKSTGYITSGTREINSASDVLSQRTESQAASLEEAATSVSDLSAKVKTAASGAKEAREFVESTRNAAIGCNNEMERTAEAMGRIAVSSQKMTQIIGTIDEIAFQTNLLALNAGVEAARAGDAGRGFAVVAHEVRELAQRSAGSAKEISELIRTSLAETKQGVKLVEATRASLAEIIGRVVKLNAIMQNLAVTAEEQALDLQNVNSAVDSIDTATQQNAAMAEETTAATRNLADQAEDLNSMIGSFVFQAKVIVAQSTKHRPRPAATGQGSRA